MNICRELGIVGFLLCFGLISAIDDANAITRIASSCSQSDVATAYSSASPGDTILVPAGNCTWTSYLVNSKSNLTIQGAGAGQTLIRIAAGNRGLQMQADGWRITGFTFDCNYSNTTNAGIVFVGSSAGNPTWRYGDWRIDHNSFTNCGAAGGDTTGYDAITLTGFVYGVIDHNTFDDCNGECINWCADGVPATLRSLDFGQYTNGTVYIEDNTFNANRAIIYENIIDGNSGQRTVLRHNTINISDGAVYGSGISSTHETCARCSSSSPEGDAGSLVTEFYENTINLNTTGQMRDFQIVRAGKALIYNNHITYSGSSAGRWNVASWISNYRSTSSYPGCGNAAHGRGYSQYTHEVDGTYISEGLEANKTTLNGNIDASQISLSLTSPNGFNAAGNDNGFAIKIDNEVIYYTGISGNTLTGLTRGASGSTAATHTNGASVHYLKFGVALEQPNNVNIWNNDINGIVMSAMNNAFICGSDNNCVGTKGTPDYTNEDIKSFTERPNNWQYRTGTVYWYVPFPYPHPLITGTGTNSPPNPPQDLRVM